LSLRSLLGRAPARARPLARRARARLALSRRLPLPRPARLARQPLPRDAPGMLESARRPLRGGPSRRVPERSGLLPLPSAPLLAIVARTRSEETTHEDPNPGPGGRDGRNDGRSGRFGPDLARRRIARRAFRPRGVA